MAINLKFAEIRQDARVNYQPDLELLELPRAELAQARSDVLDAFASLEAMVCKMLRAAEKQLPNAAQFSARLEAFKKLEGISQIAKANLQKRDRLVAEISALLPVRADIVHSRLKACQIDGLPAAIFVNSQNQSDSYPQCRILTLDAMRRMVEAILRYAKDISELGRVINPPSLPQQPSPGAKVDP